MALDVLLRVDMTDDRDVHGAPSAGNRVRFRIADAFLPDAAGLLDALTADAEVVGTIVGFSDRGTQRGVFAVVELVRGCTAIVPVEALTALEEKPRGWAQA